MRLLRFVLLSLSLTLMMLALGAVSVRGVHAATAPGSNDPMHVLPPVPCAGEPVALVVPVPDCPPCTWLVSATMNDSLRVVRVGVRLGCVTAVACRPDSVVFRLGRFQAGFHTVSVQRVTLFFHGDTLVDSTSTTLTTTFTVRGDCVTPPELPVPEHIRIGMNPGCDSCPPVACAGKPIAVHIDGHFPNSCWSVRKVELLPSLLTVIGPPRVRILLDDGGCLMRPCAAVMTPWSVDTVLPGLPVGEYRLAVETARVTCSDSILPGRIAVSVAPFAVVDSCGGPPPPEACFMTRWGPRLPGTGCNVVVAPGGEGDLVLNVATSVALAGLQGVLRAGPALRITGLEAIGPARGMNLQWRPFAGGARFVMFAPSGAPIPPVLWTPDGCDPPSCTVPVLRVHVALAPSPGAPVAFVVADSLLGADSLARAVMPCLVRSMEARIDMGTVCVAATCDANGDGHGDVRDLVLMVHCILGGGVCPDSIAGHHDCDADGDADLEDILCCARAMLGGPPRDSVPGRDEPSVALAMGEARRDGDRVTLPLTLQGADRVGALRMSLRFPSDRYDVSALSSSAGGSWLALHEVRGGEVVVGLIALAPPEVGTSVPLSLELELKSGQTHGGEVTVQSADVSTPDGAAVTTSLPGTSALIEPPASVSLALRPNPLTGSDGAVHFALPRASEVDLAVFDIAGRRVATLAHGTMPAGIHVRAWDAQGVRDGVYFVRLKADGVEIARKAVLRRGH